MFSSVLLYIPLLLLGQGFVTPNPNAWWKARLHWRDQGVILDMERRRSSDMILCAFLSLGPLLSDDTSPQLPTSICRHDRAP